MSHPMTNRMWVMLTALSCSLINHVSSHDQQGVSDTALLWSIISHPMTNSMWVTPCALLQSHQSCLIPWPTECEWHHVLYYSLINHVSSHDQQNVSDAYYFKLHSHQSCLIPWPTECEWHHVLYYSLINHVSSCDQQNVSDAHCFKLQSHQSCLIPWPTECEWCSLL